MTSENIEQTKICLNKNCWLVDTLGYNPADRCLICQLRFRECPFSQFLLTGATIISVSFIISYVLEKDISEPLIISAFVSFLVYGYLFNRSTRDIIESNCSLGKAKEGLERSKRVAEERAEELEKWYKLTIGRELRMSELKQDIEKLKENSKKK